MHYRDTHVDSRVLGDRIRLARERLRYSQEELAGMVSKDQRAISEYENGKRKLAATDLPAFSEALQVPILYFYEGELNAEALDRVVLTEFHRLNPKARQTAVDILRALSNMFD